MSNFGQLYEEYEQSPLFSAPDTTDNNTDWFSLFPDNSTQEPFKRANATTISNVGQFNDEYEVSPLFHEPYTTENTEWFPLFPEGSTQEPFKRGSFEFTSAEYQPLSRTYGLFEFLSCTRVC
jgi:hypothetical protein